MRLDSYVLPLYPPAPLLQAISLVVRKPLYGPLSDLIPYMVLDVLQRPLLSKAEAYKGLERLH